LSSRNSYKRTRGAQESQDKSWTGLDERRSLQYLTFSKNHVIIFTETRKGKEVDTPFNKMVEPSEEELTTLLGLSE